MNMNDIFEELSKEDHDDIFYFFKNIAESLYEHMEQGDEDEVFQYGNEPLKVKSLVDIFSKAVEDCTAGALKEMNGTWVKLKKMLDHYSKESLDEDEIVYDENDEDEDFEGLSVNEKLDKLNEDIPSLEEKMQDIANVFSSFLMSMVIWSSINPKVKETLVNEKDFWVATNTLFNALKFSREHILMTFITFFGYESEEEVLMHIKEEDSKLDYTVEINEDIQTYLETEFQQTLMNGICRRENSKDLFPLIMNSVQIILIPKQSLWKQVLEHPNHENLIHEWIGSFLQTQQEEENKIGEIVRWNFLKEMIKSNEELVTKLIYTSDYKCIIDSLMTSLINHSEKSTDNVFPIFANTLEIMLDSTSYVEHYKKANLEDVEEKLTNVAENPITSSQATTVAKKLLEHIQEKF